MNVSAENPGQLVCTPHRVPASVASTVHQCTRCPQQVWVSDGMLPRVQARELLPVCTDCIAAVVDDDTEFMVPLEQMRTLNEYGILREAKEFADRMNNDPDRFRILNEISKLYGKGQPW